MQNQQEPPKPSAFSHFADLAVCVVLLLVSTWAVYGLPAGGTLRVLLVLPVLLFVPGYLLVEATRTTRVRLGGRIPVGVLAPGVSLAFVALLALLTAMLPGGFRGDSIVAIVTLTCIGLTLSALYRRAQLLRAPETLQPFVPRRQRTFERFWPGRRRANAGPGQPAGNPRPNPAQPTPMARPPMLPGANRGTLPPATVRIQSAPSASRDGNGTPPNQVARPPHNPVQTGRN